ncbi:MAG: winged helix-turn-helix domain-containing protein [Xanthobacteraceae bacterium]
MAVRVREVHVDERTVEVNVGRLRKARYRGRAGDPIRTVSGSGYWLDAHFPKVA